MNEKCKYWNNGQCDYFKKFVELVDENTDFDYECVDEDCPITHPYLVKIFLDQNT